MAATDQHPLRHPSTRTIFANEAARAYSETRKAHRRRKVTSRQRGQTLRISMIVAFIIAGIGWLAVFG